MPEAMDVDAENQTETDGEGENHDGDVETGNTDEERQDLKGNEALSDTTEQGPTLYTFMVIF